mgnify:CR=1 FL=1
MIPEIGNFAIVMAMVLALVQAVVPLAGATLGNARWMAVARPGAYGQFGFLLLAFVILAYCFVSNDFTVAYVANNSNTLLPLGYLSFLILVCFIARNKQALFEDKPRRARQRRAASCPSSAAASSSRARPGPR